MKFKVGDRVILVKCAKELISDFTNCYIGEQHPNCDKGCYTVYGLEDGKEKFYYNFRESYLELDITYGTPLRIALEEENET